MVFSDLLTCWGNHLGNCTPDLYPEPYGHPSLWTALSWGTATLHPILGAPQALPKALFLRHCFSASTWLGLHEIRPAPTTAYKQQLLEVCLALQVRPQTGHFPSWSLFFHLSNGSTLSQGAGCSDRTRFLQGSRQAECGVGCWLTLPPPFLPRVALETRCSFAHLCMGLGKGLLL